MIFGNPKFLAVESEVLKYYEQRSSRALGFIVIHVGGMEYGLREADATMLACILDGSQRRLDQRGQHVCTFDYAPAEDIAAALMEIIYEEEVREDFWGLDPEAFHKHIHYKNLLWSQSGDEAFDDGSHVVQIDVGSRVRVLAFKRTSEGIDPRTLRDVWIEDVEFYNILSDWLKAFEANWTLAMSYE